MVTYLLYFPNQNQREGEGREGECKMHIYNPEKCKASSWKELQEGQELVPRGPGLSESQEGPGPCWGLAEQSFTEDTVQFPAQAHTLGGLQLL